MTLKRLTNEPPSAGMPTAVINGVVAQTGATYNARQGLVSDRQLTLRDYCSLIAVRGSVQWKVRRYGSDDQRKDLQYSVDGVRH